MPRVNIFIRKDNQDKWNAIPDKSNWINTILENADDTSRFGAIRPGPAGPMVSVLSEAPGAVGEMIDKAFDNGQGLTYFIDFKPCKHGADPKFCRFAKPGKPCK
jgi:hypothetical protein